MHFSLSRKMIVLLTITLILTAAANATVASGNSDWTQWRGPNRDGLVRDAAIPRVWPKELKEEWKVTVGIGHSTPVVANNRIYVFARQAEEEVLLCLDSATGKEIWRSSQPIAYEMHNAAKGHGKGPKSTPVLNSRTVCTLGGLRQTGDRRIDGHQALLRLGKGGATRALRGRVRNDARSAPRSRGRRVRRS